MSSDFLEWLKEHKDEYGVKIIENPTEEQKIKIGDSQKYQTTY